MRIIGCDLHSRQQTLAMLDVETGEVEECVLRHEGDRVREFYRALPHPVRVGIEATCFCTLTDRQTTDPPLRVQIMDVRNSFAAE